MQLIQRFLPFVILGIFSFPALLHRAIAEKFFVNISYWMILLLFIAWLVLSYLFCRRVLQAKLAKIPLLLTFCATLFVGLSNDFKFKTNSDETNLLGISRSLFYERTPYNATMGKNYFGSTKPIRREIDKRPIFYPFVVQAFHHIWGYTIWSGFVVNILSLFAILFLVSYYSYIHLGLCGAAAGILLTLSPSVVPSYATCAGMDVFSVFILAQALWVVLLYRREPSQENLTYLLLILAVLSQSRYESLAYVFAVLFLLFVYKELTLEKLFRSWTVHVLVLMQILTVWQRKLSVGGYQTEKGISVFGIDHFVKNLKPFLQGQFVIDWHLPYAQITNWFSYIMLVLCVYQVFWKQKDEEKQKNLLLLSACAFGSLFIFLSYHGGGYLHPANSRFFLVYNLFLALVPLYFFYLYRERSNNKHLLSLALASFLLYFPHSIDGSYYDALTLNREMDKLYAYLDKHYPNENTMIVHGRPGQFVSVGYGAVSWQYAKDNWENMLRENDRHLYEAVLIIERIRYDKKDKKTWFEERGDLQAEYYFQRSAVEFVRLSKLKKRFSSSQPENAKK
ncbi:MAG: hypothetical protein AAF518_26485 [Spirochaetota bacterium]